MHFKILLVTLAFAVHLQTPDAALQPQAQPSVADYHTAHQTTIDATGDFRPFSHPITEGHSGSIGRRLPLQLEVLASKLEFKPGGVFFVDFVLTNKGPKPLKLPVALHPVDFEPKVGNTRAFEYLSLFVTAGEKDSILLKGGADLYGAGDVAGSLVSLGSAESIRIHAKYSLTALNGRHLVGAQILTAHASLIHETLRIKGLNAEINSEELGSAASSPWTTNIEN